MKLLGSICVLLGGALLVFRQINERHRRRETLGDLISALRQMAEELRVFRYPLPQLLERAEQGRNGEVSAFFSAVSDGLKAGEDLQLCWRKAAEYLDLPPRETKLLSAAAETMHGDEESACNGISLVTQELEKCAQKWDERLADDNKRTAALAFSGAALLVILLI